MAIDRYGMPGRVAATSTNKAGMTPLDRPNITNTVQTALKPAKAALGAAQQALPPAGLPPDAWATAKMPVMGKKAKPGPLGAGLPRQISPSLPNVGRQVAKLDETQVAKQLSPETVMGMDNDKWTKMLAQFGVFA